MVLSSKIGHLPRLGFTRSIRTTAGQQHLAEWWWGPEINQGREVVGHGINGNEMYADDRFDYWYPAVRFRKHDAVIAPIREKELGDWKKLTLEEKKLLYRYSFRQTAAELEAPDAYWQLSWVSYFLVMSVALAYTAYLNIYVFKLKVPDTFDEEYMESQLERRVVMEKDFPLGVNRMFDYEKNRWKD